MRGLPSRSTVGDYRRDQRYYNRKCPNGGLLLKTIFLSWIAVSNSKILKTLSPSPTQVGEEAEKEGHHPRLTTEWGKVAVTWWTHKIRNLHKNDFIMAAKTDVIYRKYG